MKILLTGGNGFIGKNILKALGRQFEILAPRSFDLDLLDQAAVANYLRAAKPDVVIHAASIGQNIGWDNDQPIVENNLRMYFNLHQCSDNYGKMIVFGSGAEYDKSRDISLVKEDEFGTNIPCERYAFSKYVMSKYAERTPNIYHLRMFGIFGPYENYARRFISNIICMALHDQPLLIKQNAKFDYLYIDDFIGILREFIVRDHFNYNVYNIGRGEPVELLSVAQTILKVIGKKLPVNVNEKGLNKEYTCNVERLQAELPNIEYTQIESAIGVMIDFYKKNLPDIGSNLLLTDK